MVFGCLQLAADTYTNAAKLHEKEDDLERAPRKNNLSSAPIYLLKV
jgi:hypothetical protein